MNNPHWKRFIELVVLCSLVLYALNACAGNSSSVTKTSISSSPGASVTPDYGKQAKDLYEAKEKKYPHVNFDATVDWISVNVKGVPRNPSCSVDEHNNVVCTIIQFGSAESLEVVTSGTGTLTVSIDQPQRASGSTMIGSFQVKDGKNPIPLPPEVIQKGMGIRSIWFYVTSGNFKILQFGSITRQNSASFSTQDLCEHNDEAVLAKKGITPSAQYYCLQWLQDIQPFGSSPSGGSITLKPGQTFTWKFLVKNAGTLPITGNVCRIEAISQSRQTGEPAIHIDIKDWNFSDLQPGGQGDITLTFTAPQQEDTFYQTYEVTLPDGTGIRDELSILFTVKA